MSNKLDLDLDVWLGGWGVFFLNVQFEQLYSVNDLIHGPPKVVHARLEEGEVINIQLTRISWKG